jgi:hypothetical protein
MQPSHDVQVIRYRATLLKPAIILAMLLLSLPRALSRVLQPAIVIGGLPALWRTPYHI